MLIDWIAANYRYLWVAFGAFALLKILFAWNFHGALDGMNNMIVSIFKWYGQNEMEMEDEQHRRQTMVLLNGLTFFVLLTLMATLAAGLLLFILG